MLTVVLLLIFGCKYQVKADKVHDLNVEVLYKSIQCGRSDKDPAATWITDKRQLRQVYERIEKHILGSNPDVPFVDFDEDGILFIEMGQRPTAGYYFDTEQASASARNGIVSVKMSWIEPEAGSMQPQVITSPCVLIRFQAYDYSHISVLNQNNQVMIQD